ncbi:hypothetical protein PACTADRAFT_3391 [Pachysolen tannophilus NRRL Y-2460]|uniref:Uncharacterized protein n=1 Tax=Pachysolen tannophilus NRRL Y-2460 TaxID=669874 RepID=A0A1E4TVA7_PACTA|nr:hypothetical protein PACTADRAFT_3391 [Pachysolen tannophilus NRRL Y-2460]
MSSSSSSSYIPQTPPRSHKKTKRGNNSPFTPNSPVTRTCHNNKDKVSLDFKISSKTSLLKTPSSTSHQQGKPFTIYQTPITPLSIAHKRTRSDLIPTTPVSFTQTSSKEGLTTPQFSGRLLFPVNPARIGSGRSHHKASLKTPSLTSLLNKAALSESEGDISGEEDEAELFEQRGPSTPKKQLFFQTPRTPPKLKKRKDEEDIINDLDNNLGSRKRKNVFINEKEEDKREIVYVNRYGEKKVQKLNEKEVQALKHTKRKLSFT